MKPGKPTIKECLKCSKYIELPTLLSGNTFGSKYWTDGKVYSPMLPDLDDIIKCPHCSNLLWVNKLNTIGSIQKFVYSKKSKESIFYDKLKLDDYFSMIDNINLSKKKRKYIHLQIWWLSNDKRRQSYPIKSYLNEIGNELKNISRDYICKGFISKEDPTIIYNYYKNIVLKLNHKFLVSSYNKGTLKKNIKKFIKMNHEYTNYKDIKEYCLRYLLLLNKIISRLNKNNEKYKPLSNKEIKNLNLLYNILGNCDEDLIMKAEIKRELGQFDEALKVLNQNFNNNKNENIIFIVSYITQLIKKSERIVKEIQF